MKKDNEPRFIPCGDSMEKMAELRDDELENVSGGTETTQTNQDTRKIKILMHCSEYIIQEENI